MSAGSSADGDYAASFVQERLHLVERLAGTSLRLHKRLLLNRPLDDETLLRAIRAVHARHPLLRTVFSETGGQLRQRPLQAEAWPVLAEGLEEAPGGGPRASPPPAAWRRDGDSLEVSLRPIVCDGHSLRLMLGDLSSAIAGRALEGAPATHMPYHLYAQRERDAWTPATANRLRTEWQAALEPIEPTSLPYDAAAVAGAPGGHHTVTRSLEAAATAALRERAQELGATPAAACLAAWRSVLQRWSGNSEPLTFVAVSRRTRRALATTVGPFTDFLPVPATATRRTAHPIEEAADRMLTLLEHGQAPLQTVVGVSPPDVGGPRGPFTALLTYVPDSEHGIVGPWEEEEHDPPEDFDMHLVAFDRRDGLELKLRGQAALFERATVDAGASHVAEELADLTAARSPSAHGRVAGARRAAAPRRPPAAAEPWTPPDSAHQAIADAWESVLGRAPASVDEDFRAAGGHSLLVPELRDAIERFAGTALTLEAVCRTRMTVHALVAAVAAPVVAPRRPPSVLAARAEALERVPTGPFPPPPPKARGWFLTGATGFLGAHVLVELLRDPSVRVRCLVRAPAAEGHEALAKSLADLDLEAGIDWSRVEIVHGDLEAPRLGLRSADGNGLTRDTDAIIHAAAWVNFLYPYEVLAPVNVYGTTQVLELATRCRASRMHLVSSLGVLAAANGGRGGASGYAMTKWVAEEAVLEAARRGLAVTCTRAPWILGHRGSGACQPQDLLWAVLVSCLELGVAPDVDFAVPCSTVEAVVRAVVSPDSDPSPAVPDTVGGVTWRRLLEAGAELHGQPKRVPVEDWLAFTATNTPARLAPFLELMRTVATRDGTWNPVEQETRAYAEDCAQVEICGREVDDLIGRCLRFMSDRDRRTP